MDTVWYMYAPSTVFQQCVLIKQIQGQNSNEEGPSQYSVGSYVLNCIYSEALFQRCVPSISRPKNAALQVYSLFIHLFYIIVYDHPLAPTGGPNSIKSVWVTSTVLGDCMRRAHCLSMEVQSVFQFLYNFGIIIGNIYMFS